MEEEIDQEVIKATQISLGKYIKRPPLSEKLLKKPPFRFLHDIITTVLNTTGFFEGLFDENELISDNVKDRESKISFLNKVISIISLTTGKSLSVKPSKIVAGQEPMKTNELLQCLASALDNNLSSHEAVNRYKESTKKHSKDQTQVKTKVPIKPKKKAQESKKNENVIIDKRESSDISNSKKDKEKANDSSIKKRNSPVKIESRNKNTQPKIIPKKVISETKLQSQSKKQLTPRVESGEHIKKKQFENNEINTLLLDSKDPSKESEKNIEILEVHADTTDKTTFSISEETLKYRSADILADVNNDKCDDDNSNDNKKTILKTDKQAINENIVENAKLYNLNTDENLPHENKNYNLRENDLVNDLESLRKTPPEQETEKNTSKKTDLYIRSANVRPSSSRPGAPRPKDKFENIISDTDSHLLGKVNIITEHGQNEEEDDSSLIITEQNESISSVSKDNYDELNQSINEHGHLVQQILDSQKEFSQVNGKTEIDWQLGAQKAKAAQHKEVELLRYNIQALTRVTNPLGKLLDHIQEDVEVMRQELQQWLNIYEEVSKEIAKQKALSEESLHPLHSKLKQLELGVQEKSEKINDVKMLIHKNSSRIQKLLSNENVQ